MVGLVIVSHSRALAEALAGLVRQVASVQLPIAIAAGVGEDRQEFGTDAVEISEAIQSVDSPDGVLVMMDLGSAVLSSDMALELLPPEMRAHVRVCPGPLVEGCVAAGVQMGMGSRLETIFAEAVQSLKPKVSQLEPRPGISEQGPSEISQPAGGNLVRQTTLSLKNQYGLHARPAARFVQTASRFAADVKVTNLTKHTGPASAKSLNALATLEAVKGHQIEITATGPDADQAVQALSRLVNEGFGESR